MRERDADVPDGEFVAGKSVTLKRSIGGHGRPTLTEDEEGMLQGRLDRHINSMVADAESEYGRSSVGKFFDFDDGRRVYSKIAGDVGALDEVFRPQILNALQLAAG